MKMLHCGTIAFSLRARIGGVMIVYKAFDRSSGELRFPALPVGVPARPASPYGSIGEKPALSPRLRDIVIALLALTFFSPLMIVIALVIACSGGPVLYGHTRIGRGGHAFKCLKFRTMHVNGDQLLARLLADNPAALAEWQRDHKLRSDPRVTRMGALLRKTSLDELPQLFNVLSGAMSIVGPRPIVQAEAFRYGRYFQAYCQVRPGITGLWQISGRSSTTYRRRVACDVAYVRSRSTLTDMRIIVKTIPAVCFTRGAY